MIPDLYFAQHSAAVEMSRRARVQAEQDMAAAKREVKDSDGKVIEGEYEDMTATQQGQVLLADLREQAGIKDE